MAYKDKEQKRLNAQKYYQSNKEKINEKNKQWYSNNKERAQKQHKEYYEYNKESLLKQQKEYYKNNKDTIDTRNRKWAQDNAEKVSEYQRDYYQTNKERITEHNKQWKQANRDKMLAYQREWSHANWERSKYAHNNKRLERIYRLTREQYDRLLEIQENRYPVCTQIFLLNRHKSVDHDHVTSQVRGILHSNCNFLLGFADDNIDTLIGAYNYLCSERYFEPSDITVIPDPSCLVSNYFQLKSHKYIMSKRRTLKYKYGLSLEQFYQIFRNQNYTCPICNQLLDPDYTSIDHCHTSNKLRGIIHKKCNSLLGFAGDSRDNCIRAIEYLISPPAKTLYTSN